LGRGRKQRNFLSLQRRSYRLISSPSSGGGGLRRGRKKG